MSLDNAKNFAKATVSTGYGAGATSIVLNSGGGAKLPTAPFNLVWWNATDYSDPSDDPNVEIVRCTNKSGETLTITRAQEGTSASSKNTAGKTYKVIAPLTAKVINTDIPAIGLSVIEKTGGIIDDSNLAFTFASKPTFIAVNTSIIRENHGWTWNSGTLTATLT